MRPRNTQLRPRRLRKPGGYWTPGVSAETGAPACDTSAFDNTAPSWCHAAIMKDEVVTLLQQLIRIDTTNPPGNETPAAQLLAERFRDGGLEPVLVGRTPERQNVVARLRGNGKKKPLLLAAHLDVVPAEPQGWRHPPFAGEIHDGYLWGRGAIDMKHMAAMSTLVLLQLKRDGVTLDRDV